jgi:hypothetical protein
MSLATIAIRLSPDEAKRVEAAAQMAGKSTSQFCRDAVMASVPELQGTAPSPVREPPEGWETMSFEQIAEWLANDFAQHISTEVGPAEASRAKDWYNVSLLSKRAAVAIIRYGDSYVRPALTLPDAVYRVEQDNWPTWLRDRGSHVLRGGPTLRSRSVIWESIDRLRQLALVASR